MGSQRGGRILVQPWQERLAAANAPRARLMPMWWVAATGLGLCSIVIIIYVVNALHWIHYTSDFLAHADMPSIVAGASARRAVDRDTTLYWMSYLVAGICFVAWFRAAYKILEDDGVALRFSRGWAIGSWLVPFLSFVRPKQIANDIWRGSHLRHATGNVGARPVSSVVHWWWGLYLLGGAVFGVGTGLSRGGTSGDSVVQILTLQRTGFWVAVVGAFMLLTAAVLAATFAWKASQAHDAHGLRGGGF
jgi:Domain of unknown function (DUF4328)